MSENLTFSVSDFVGVFNQTLEFAYPTVSIVGELSNFKISKGKWIYFDLKDDNASIRFFGTIYALPGPLEDGLKLQVTGIPRLHPNFGFSITVQHMQAVGEGSIKKASALLEAKLKAEGLFDADRKRSILFPPQKIGLVASAESAAYADFIKILDQRWGGIEIIHADVQVQGEAAPAQISSAIERLNASYDLDAIVITRGGGSTDDLQAFSTEKVVRAVAGSRAPTLVAVGHEVDTSLAEMTADVWASTPSNAAEILVPEKNAVISILRTNTKQCLHVIQNQLYRVRTSSTNNLNLAKNSTLQSVSTQRDKLKIVQQLLHSYDPRRILKQGYVLLSSRVGTVASVEKLQVGQEVTMRLIDGIADATVTKIKKV